MTDRHFGIGSDGILIVSKPENTEAHVKYSFFNFSGEEAELCGNGVRCFVKFLKDYNLIPN